MFKSAIFLQFTFITTIPLHLLCTQHLQNGQKMELLPTSILQRAQENLPFSVICPAFPLLIIIFVF